MAGVDLIAVRGGLGNQLFAWAYGRARELDGRHVFFSFASQYHRSAEIRGLIGNPWRRPIVPESVWRRLVRAGRSRLGPVRLIIEDDGTTLRESSPDSHLAVHWGYWQDPQYFWRYAPTVRNEVNVWLGREQDQQLAGWCALHVRRGDYVTNAAARALMGNLDQTYYWAAIQYMRARGFTRFRVFSDDPEWVMRNWFANPPAGLVVQEASPGGALDDLREIASCGAVITANSTYSWWGAFLGAPDRPVVVPTQWFASDPRLSARIVPPNWQRLP